MAHIGFVSTSVLESKDGVSLELNGKGDIRRAVCSNPVTVAHPAVFFPRQRHLLPVGRQNNPTQIKY